MKEALPLIEFACVLAVIAIAAFLLPPVKYHKDDSHHVFIKVSIGVALLLLVSFTVDNVLSITLSHFSVVRLIAATLAYMLRPVLFYLLVLTIKRKSLKVELLICIPIFFNIVLLIASLPTQCVFSFGESNNFIRGPLGYVPIIVAALYLVYLLVNIILLFKDRHFIEVIPLLFIVFSGVIFTILGFIGVTTYSFDFLMVVGSVFYTLLLNIYYSKRDSLTGMFNHQSYYSDASMRHKRIVAVFSIDMNGLKSINDNEGHQAGDKALVSIAEAILESDHKNVLSRCYRIGGDEFAIICLSGNENDVEKYMNNIKQKVEKTGFTASVGYYYRKNNDETFSEMYDLADKNMYEDKKQYYQDKQ